MNIIAHRGVYDNINVFENTIKAFKLALNKNLAIELDVNITKDKELIVFHDNNLKRLYKVSKDIFYLDSEDLKKYKIPKLNEVLKLVNGKVPLYIEVKDSKYIKETCNKLLSMLKEYKKEVYIQSFNKDVVKFFLDNGYKSGLLITNNLVSKWYKNNIRLYFLIKKLKPSFLAIERHRKTHKYMLKYRILLWTFNNVLDIKKYNDKYYFVCDNLLK